VGSSPLYNPFHKEMLCPIPVSTNSSWMDVTGHRKPVTVSRALKNTLHRERLQYLNLFRQLRKGGNSTTVCYKGLTTQIPAVRQTEV